MVEQERHWATCVSYDERTREFRVETDDAGEVFVGYREPSAMPDVGTKGGLVYKPDRQAALFSWVGGSKPVFRRLL